MSRSFLGILPHLAKAPGVSDDELFGLEKDEEERRDSRYAPLATACHASGVVQQGGETPVAEAKQIVQILDAPGKRKLWGPLS